MALGWGPSNLSCETCFSFFFSLASYFHVPEMMALATPATSLVRHSRRHQRARMYLKQCHLSTKQTFAFPITRTNIIFYSEHSSLCVHSIHLSMPAWLKIVVGLFWQKEQSSLPDQTKLTNPHYLLSKHSKRGTDKDTGKIETVTFHNFGNVPQNTYIKKIIHNNNIMMSKNKMMKQSTLEWPEL